MITFLKSLLKDETYINLWRGAVQKTEGHRVVIFLVAILVLVYLAIATINASSWPLWTGLGEKTAWDLADLLLVPIVLALIAYFFNKRQKEQELEIARKERENEREIAQDRAQETALQNYLDRMTELLLPPNNLKDSAEDAKVRSIARARTLTVLRSLRGTSLSAELKGRVVQFLQESGLILVEKTIIPLEGADLIKANLKKADLIKANLRGAKLSKAELIGAHLRGADLRGADLRGAYLWGADLGGAKLWGADLSHAALGVANLSGADLSQANLTDADLSRATLSGANLSGADLSEAELNEAKLSGAELIEADLIGAHLRGADLSGTDLSGAKLSGAVYYGANYKREIELWGAKLSGANLSGTDLSGTDLSGAEYNYLTQWPDGFDPEQAGAINIEKVQAETTGITPPRARSSDKENFSTNETLRREEGTNDQTQAKS